MAPTHIEIRRAKSQDEPYTLSNSFWFFILTTEPSLNLS